MSSSRETIRCSDYNRAMIVMSYSNVLFHVEILNTIAPVIPGENPWAWGGVLDMIAGSRGFNHYRIRESG